MRSFTLPDIFNVIRFGVETNPKSYGNVLNYSEIKGPLSSVRSIPLRNERFYSNHNSQKDY